MVDSCQGKLLEFCSNNYLIHQHAQALEGIQVICLDGLGTIFNLAKVNPIPGCVLPLSLRHEGMTGYIAYIHRKDN